MDEHSGAIAADCSTAAKLGAWMSLIARSQCAGASRLRSLRTLTHLPSRRCRSQNRCGDARRSPRAALPFHRRPTPIHRLHRVRERPRRVVLAQLPRPRRLRPPHLSRHPRRSHDPLRLRMRARHRTSTRARNRARPKTPRRRRNHASPRRRDLHRRRPQRNARRHRQHPPRNRCRRSCAKRRRPASPSRATSRAQPTARRARSASSAGWSATCRRSIASERSTISC